MTSEPAPWRTRVRAVVLHPHEPNALVLDTEDGPDVPAYEMPGRIWSGRAAVLVEAARAALGIEPVLLREVDARLDEVAQVRHLTLVFVVRGTGAEPPPKARWLGLDEAADLPDVAAVLAERAAGQVPRGRPAWREPDWLPVAEAWIVERLAALGRPVRGPVEQFRLAELSCVLRVPTDAGNVYFKATTRSPLFVDEGRVMATLSDMFPGEIPAPLAVDTDRHWMLLPDFGPDIGWQAPVEVREDVCRAYARLQIRSVDAVDRLLASGCFDRTHKWMAEQATGWLATVDLSRWLDAGEADELRAAGPAIAAACEALDRLPVPCTIGHGDMHLGNVARRDGGYVFFDWTDACVMHPFVDMFDIAYADDADTRDRLRDAYLAEWAAVAPYDSLLEAWRLARPLGAFNQAISYISIATHLEDGPDNDGLREETGRWLRRVLDWSRELLERDRVAL